MPNHVSAIKRMRQTERRTAINRARKSRLRNGIRAMRRVLAGKDPAAAKALLPETFSIIDKAAKVGIIKTNTAARYKSKLHLRVRSMEAPAAR